MKYFGAARNDESQQKYDRICFLTHNQSNAWGMLKKRLK